MTLGEKIRNRRLELGMTQDELAQKLGFKSRSSINKVEMDAKGIKMTRIDDYAKALCLPVEYLMGWEDDPDIIAGMAAVDYMLDTELNLFIEKYKQLNHPNQAAVRTMVDSLLIQQSKNESN